MKIDVPFYKNDGDGKQCFQACIRSVNNYYGLPDKTLDELDTLTRRGPNESTSTPQLILATQALGLETTFYSGAPLDQYLHGEEHLQEQYGHQADRMLAMNNIQASAQAAQNISELELFEQRVPQEDELIEWLDNQTPLIMLVDWNVVTQKTGDYQGHLIVITGYDKQNFFVHNSGPKKSQAHQPIPREKLLEAWNAPGTDNDLVVVHGKKR